MTEPKKSANQDLIRAVWDEARDLIKRLEGSTVQRFSVEAGDTKIEIERGMPAGVVASALPAPAAAAAAGEDSGGPAGADDRHPIKAPLVGTFYGAPQPGADPFVKEGDSVEVGQTVAIVEAMKLMNHVQADAAGVVAEIAVVDGQWVEFEQPLIYLAPAGESED
jgi:acetyl-CoA carboxylase biotin carboxyl carrier protein